MGNIFKVTVEITKALEEDVTLSFQLKLKEYPGDLITKNILSSRLVTERYATINNFSEQAITCQRDENKIRLGVKVPKGLYQDAITPVKQYVNSHDLPTTSNFSTCPFMFVKEGDLDNGNRVWGAISLKRNGTYVLKLISITGKIPSSEPNCGIKFFLQGNPTTSAVISKQNLFVSWVRNVGHVDEFTVNLGEGKGYTAYILPQAVFQRYGNDSTKNLTTLLTFNYEIILKDQPSFVNPNEIIDLVTNEKSTKLTFSIKVDKNTTKEKQARLTMDDPNYYTKRQLTAFDFIDRDSSNTLTGIILKQNTTYKLTIIDVNSNDLNYKFYLTGSFNDPDNPSTPKYVKSFRQEPAPIPKNNFYILNKNIVSNGTIHEYRGWFTNPSLTDGIVKFELTIDS